MRQLREHFRPMALDDLVRVAASGAIPDGAVAVTFDDGYLDALTVASPILMEFGIPATFFVNTDRLDKEHERWWDILERVFLTIPSLPPRLQLLVGDNALQFATHTSAERQDALDAINRGARHAIPVDPATERVV